MVENARITDYIQLVYSRSEVGPPPIHLVLQRNGITKLID